MLDTRCRISNPSHVTVRFGEANHSFQLLDGATMGDLAEHISTISSQHDDVPLGIVIEFSVPATRPISETTLRNLPTP